MRCKIQWVDEKTGKFTPDNNEAIGLAVCMTATGGPTLPAYPICEEHAKRLVPHHVSWGTDHEVVTEWRLFRFNVEARIRELEALKENAEQEAMDRDLSE